MTNGFGLRRVSRLAIVVAVAVATSGVGVVTAGGAMAPLKAYGTVQCTVAGKAKFAPPLFAVAQPGRAVSIKATLSCTIGETGDHDRVVTSGKLVASVGRSPSARRRPDV
jgi:hypothetical protein